MHIKHTQVSKNVIVSVANTVETTEHEHIKSKNAELCNCDDISNIVTFSTLILLGLVPCYNVRFVDLFLF